MNNFIIVIIDIIICVIAGFIGAKLTILTIGEPPEAIKAIRRFCARHGLPLFYVRQRTLCARVKRKKQLAITKMTFREKLAEEHPEFIRPCFYGGCDDCPYRYGYESAEDRPCKNRGFDCYECWDRVMPETAVEVKSE